MDQETAQALIALLFSEQATFGEAPSQKLLFPGNVWCDAATAYNRWRRLGGTGQNCSKIQGTHSPSSPDCKAVVVVKDTDQACKGPGEPAKNSDQR